MVERYIEEINYSFSNEWELNLFLRVLDDDEKLSSRLRYYLRHKSIERFYEN